MLKLNRRSRIEIFLKLTALHSFAVGIGLIFLPAEYLQFFGFANTSACFFQLQGGVFHWVMTIAYWQAAKYLEKSPGLIHFIIAAKSMAFVFLIIYFTVIEHSWMVLVSAIGDGLMALIIFVLYRRYQLNPGDV